MIERAYEIIESEIKALKSLNLNEDTLVKCVNLFSKCQGKVVFLGMGKAGIVSRKISSTLSSVGVSSIFINPAEAVHGDLGMIQNQDVIVVLSNSGKTQEILLVLQLCKKVFSCPIVGICGSINSEMAKYCDLVLEIGLIKEAGPFCLVPTSSTTVMMVVGDILTTLTAEERGVSMEQYLNFHHSGYIGQTIKEQIKQ
jgi:arabinose-5-phosphate isomerase